MKRLTLAAAVTALALPASAAAATSSGVVLSVDQQHHLIQVVDSRHNVHAYHFRGHLGRLHTGSAIAFSASQGRISHVRVLSNASHSVSYLARVVRSGKRGLVLRLADGRTLKFSAGQVRHKRLKPAQRHRPHRAHRAGDVSVSSGGVTVNITGLEPGVTVLITENVDSQGNVTITITLPAPGSGSGSGQQQASGVVSQVNTDTFDVTTDDGSDLHLHMAASALSNLNLQNCDLVDVSYHQDSSMLIADQVNQTGTSTSGDCAPDQSPQDTVGTITAVSGDSVTITAQDSQQSMTFTVDDPSVTDGFAVGDLVDVTYTQASDNSLDASDVEYVEQDATGTVTSVSDGSLTITDDQGNSDTFTADPSQGMFDGVALGDSVDVTYHTSAPGNVADVVNDPSAQGDDSGD